MGIINVPLLYLNISSVSVSKEVEACNLIQPLLPVPEWLHCSSEPLISKTVEIF